jgi:type I restriction enzyme S subunit
MSDWKSEQVETILRAITIPKTKKVPTAEVRASGRYPVVDQGKKLIAGYVDDSNNVMRFEQPVVIFGDHTRVVKLVDFPFAPGADGTKVLLPREDGLDPIYAYFALHHLKIPARGYNRHFRLLKESKIPVPGLREQKKIAAVLSTVQRAIEAQERIITTTTELKKALMQKLFTEGLHGEPQKQTEIGPVPESWEVVTLGEVTLLTQYGISRRGSAEGNVPMLRMTNQKEGRIDLTDLQYVKVDERELEKYRVKLGDILFNRTNSLELVGRTAIFDLPTNCIFASYLIRLQTCKDRVNAYYVNAYLNLDSTQQRLKSIATRAVSQSNISATRLKGFLFPLAGKEEQEQIINVERVLLDRLRTARLKKARLTELFHTLLHQLMTAQVRVHDIDLSFLDDLSTDDTARREEAG